MGLPSAPAGADTDQRRMPHSRPTRLSIRRDIPRRHLPVLNLRCSCHKLFQSGNLGKTMQRNRSRANPFRRRAYNFLVEGKLLIIWVKAPGMHAVHAELPIFSAAQPRGQICNMRRLQVKEQMRLCCTLCMHPWHLPRAHQRNVPLCSFDTPTDSPQQLPCYISLWHIACSQTLPQ